MEKPRKLIMLDELNLGERNLLEDWFQNTSFKTEQPIWVRFVYDVLTLFFGTAYFAVKPKTDQSIEKISWINGLLAEKDRPGSFYALIDVCRMIQYMIEQLPESIQNEAMDLRKSPKLLRSFFYELFIYRLLDGNKIPNQKKVLLSGQVLEGICEIDGRTFLFECRKAFIPDLELLDMVRRLIDASILVIRDNKPSHRMICRLTFKRPLTGSQQHILLNKFTSYLKKALPSNEAVILFRDECESGSLIVSEYSEEKLAALRKDHDYDVIIGFQGLQAHEQSGAMINPTFIGGNYSVANEKVYKKIKAVLREKHRQHRNSPIKDRIIFIDSEILPEFQMNIFQTDSMFDCDRIRAIHKNLGMTEIVCITRRIFMDEGPVLAVDVIAPPAEIEMEERIKNLFQIMYNRMMPYS